MTRDLFLLAAAGAHAGSSAGREWEDRVADHMTLRSVPIETLPGGYSVFGFTSLSGLQHQVDMTMGANDALVILECKAYRGALPKNELLRFKAVTDDYYMALGASIPKMPVFRIFGGPGRAERELRRYAGLHGIVVIDQDLWPVPYLLTGEAHDPYADVAGLARLCQPMQSLLARSADGTYRTRFDVHGVDWLLDAHDRCSMSYWALLDAQPGAFEDLLAARIPAVRRIA